MRVMTRRRSRQQREPHPHLYLVPSERRESERAVAALDPHARGGRVLFEVPFVSAMTGGELDLLRHQLGFTMHVDHKLPVDPNSPGFASFDHHSALFLERVAADDWWVLQARTWGSPSEETIRGWHLRTALIARQIDPMVSLPRQQAAVVA